MKNVSKLIVALGFVCFLLSGCITLQVTTEVESDGSGINTTIFGIHSESYKEAMGVWSAVDIFADARREAYEAGAQVQDWTDGEYEGLKIVYNFTSLEELENQVMSSEATAGYLDWFSIRREGDVFVYDVAMNLEDTLLPPLRHQKFTFTFETPGEIVSFSEPDMARRVRSNRVVWELDPSLRSSFELHAEGKVQKSPVQRLLPVGGGLVGLAVLGGVVLLVVLLVQRQSQRASSRKRFIEDDDFGDGYETFEASDFGDMGNEYQVDGDHDDYEFGVDEDNTNYGW